MLDLGLIRRNQQLEIANKIYAEVIPRSLVFSTQYTITHQTSWYMDTSGKLDLPKLLDAFQEFFGRHSESWLERFDYKEAGPQLLLQAFLQSILNSGGRIEREYGLGRLRTDLLVIWPYSESNRQTAVIELKIKQIKILAQSSSPTESKLARELHQIVYRNRNNLLYDEIENIFESIGVMMKPKVGVAGLRQAAGFINIFESYQDTKVTAICDINEPLLNDVKFGLEVRAISVPKSHSFKFKTTKTQRTQRI